MNSVNPRLDDFVALLRERLADPKNVQKSDWRELGSWTLTSWLVDEVGEMLHEIANNDHLAVINECCDIAALAMMIADKYKNMSSSNANLR